MGTAGASFAQSFANTLIQGHQIMAQVQDRKERLELEKKLATAKLQEHDATTQLATRQLRGLTDLQARMTATSWPDSELGAGGGTTPAPLSEQERQDFGMRLAGPETLAKSLLDPKQDIRAWFKSSMMGGGDVTAPAGGPAPQTGVPEQVAGPPAAPAPAAAGAPTTDLGPQKKLDKKWSIDSDGKMTFTVGDRNVQYKMEHVTAVNPTDGKPWVYRIITDPENPARTQTIPMAPAPPPAEVAQWDTAATSLGLKPGTALHEAAVADMIYASKALQGGTQQQAFIAIEQKYRQLAADPKLNGAPKAAATTATAPASTNLTGNAVAAANQQEIAQAAAKVEAEARARLKVPEKASPAERDKIAGQLSASDLYTQIKGLYEPGFVGGLRGGPSATVREKTGFMSQKEQQFRTAVTTANNQMIKDITGAQMSEHEATRLLRQMPDPTLPAKEFEARLKQTQINQKIIGIRRRQVLETTGVDVSNVPSLTLTTEERRQVIAPIMQDLQLGQITRDEAAKQLTGLAQYTPQQAAWMLDSKTFGGGGR